MPSYSLSHLSDRDLLRGLASLVVDDRTTTAMLLAHIAEVDARRLYVPAGFPSMFLYCVHELHLSEESAFKRIRAARTARQFPAIFEAVAEGRLHLSAVLMLAPYLTPENGGELLAAATHKTRAEIEQLLAQRFPRPDLPARVQALSPATLSTEPSSSPGPVDQHAPGRVESERPKVTTLARQRFALQVTLEQTTHDKLRYLQALLSHQVPSGELARVLDRTFDAAIRELERGKFAATTKPRPGQGRSRPRGRYIPSAVKRAVWERDGGRCTFVSATGQRCPARRLLEFDHLNPVALGGQATVEGVRLRCRAHNQHAAECTFGAEFMCHKREEARRARAEARAAAEAAAAEARDRAAAEAEKARELDVIPWLRELGFRADQARRAAAHCDNTIPVAPLEERLRAALRFLSPPARRWHPAPSGLAPAP